MSERGSTERLEPHAEPKRIVQFKFSIEQPDSYVYSNVAGVSITPWDVRINFADVNPEITTAGDDNSIDAGPIKALTGIIMPPEHAAGLAILLFEQLHVFEKQFGKIRNRHWRSMSDSTSTEPPSTP